jgi:hypothetical protein
MQNQIISAAPVLSLYMAELADEQVNHDGLILLPGVEDERFQNAQLIPVRDDYADLWNRHEAALDEIKELKAAIRGYLNLPIPSTRAVLYAKVGLDVPGQKRDTEVGT